MMLVLSRKKGEQLIIGDVVRIVVTKIQGNRVWLGFEGPKEVKVVRKEIYHDRHEEEAA